MAGQKKQSAKAPKKDITVKHDGTLESMIKMAITTKPKGNTKKDK